MSNTNYVRDGRHLMNPSRAGVGVSGGEVSTSPAPSMPPDSISVEPRSSRFTDLCAGGYSSAKFGIMLVNDGNGGYYAAFSDNRQPNVQVLFNTPYELRTAVMLQQAMLASWESELERDKQVTISMNPNVY